MPDAAKKTPKHDDQHRADWVDDRRDEREVRQDDREVRRDETHEDRRHDQPVVTPAVTPTEDRDDVGA